MNAKIPLIERPVVFDERLEQYVATLKNLGIERKTNPSLQLITHKEINSIPAESKMDVANLVKESAENIFNHGPSYARVLRARYFYKRTGYFGLSLAVDREVGEERLNIANAVSEGGIDTSAKPFSDFRFSIILGTCASLPVDKTREELFEIINDSCIDGIVLGSPQ